MDFENIFMADNVICTSYNYLPVISVMLVGAQYLRLGNCLFSLCPRLGKRTLVVFSLRQF